MPPMKINTTLGALADAEAAIQKVLAVKFDKAGGAKVRYHLVKLAKLVAVETKHFYEERNALIEQYGEGTPPSLSQKSAGWPAFSAAAKELAAIPVTIPWGRLTDAMVEPYADITAADLVSLGPLFDLDPFVVETACSPDGS